MGGRKTCSVGNRVVLGATAGAMALCVNVGHSAVQIPHVAPPTTSTTDENITVSVSVPADVAFDGGKGTGNAVRAAGTHRLYLPSAPTKPATNDASPDPLPVHKNIAVSASVAVTSDGRPGRPRATDDTKQASEMIILPPPATNPLIPQTTAGSESNLNSESTGTSSGARTDSARSASGAESRADSTQSSNSGSNMQGGQAPSSAGESASGQGASTASNGGTSSGSGQSSGSVAGIANAAGKAVGGAVESAGRAADNAVGAANHAAGGVAGGTGGLLK
jgi:hypothetical protein